MKKLNRKSASPLLLRRPTPAPYFHLLFQIFQGLPGPEEIIKIYSPPFKKGGGIQIMACQSVHHLGKKTWIDSNLHKWSQNTIRRRLWRVSWRFWKQSWQLVSWFLKRLCFPLRFQVLPLGIKNTWKSSRVLETCFDGR